MWETRKGCPLICLLRRCTCFAIAKEHESSASMAMLWTCRPPRSVVVAPHVHYPWHTRGGMKFLILVLLSVIASVGEAHHSMSGVPVKSAKCGWLEGESLRDVRNVTDFCAQSIGSGTRINSVTSDRERLWIEAPPQLAADVRSGESAARQRLGVWLKDWRRITGLRTASVSLVVNHVDVVKAETTMSGDVISIR
jgi:hypothetical protein